MSPIPSGFCHATVNAKAGIGKLGLMISIKTGDETALISGWCFITKPEIDCFDKGTLRLTALAVMAEKYPECIPYLSIPPPARIDFTGESPRIELPLLRRIWHWARCCMDR